MFTLVLATALGAPPQTYEVVNLMPATFTVVNRLPESQPATLTTTTGRTLRWTGSTYVYADDVPSSLVPTSAPVVQYSEPVFGSCASGNCSTAPVNRTPRFAFPRK